MIHIDTERLVIRPYKISDLDDHYKILSDKKNLYYLDDIVTSTKEDAKLNLLEAIWLNENDKARRLAITFAHKPQLIGSVGYDIIETTPLGKIGHMGWFILPKHQNKGYITEAVKSVLKFAFDEDNCFRITTGCHKENIASMRVMEKIGFKLEAEKIKAVYHDGIMKDRLEYAINKDDYIYKLRF